MRLLILGGTAWLGRELAVAAVRAGHEVTCVARGTSGEPPPGARFVHADRDLDEAFDASGELDGPWDVVLDVSRQPGQVRRAVAALAPRAAFFGYVSSASVYADHSVAGADESAPTVDPVPGDVMASPESYGQAKVACENHVRAVFGERCLIARAGLIGGPGDHTGRTGYWPLRFARPSTPDGRVLVPDALRLATQVIDVRDLASWLVTASGERRGGTYNAMGPVIGLGDHLQTARRVAGHTGELVRVGEEWLLTHGVEPWMGPRSLPLWLPGTDHAAFGDRDTSAARRAGLACRPLAETLQATLSWELGRDAGTPRFAGLTDDEERELLALV